MRHIAAPVHVVCVGAAIFAATCLPGTGVRMTADPTPRAAPRLDLRAITFHNVRSIIALKVAEAQSPYVAPNATSIAEGLLNPGG